MPSRTCVRALVWWRPFVAVMLVAAPSAGAQAKDGCQLPDTTAVWAQRQRAWFADSAGSWKDDSTRRALLSAAGIGSAQIPFLLGAEIANDSTQRITGASADAARETLRMLSRSRGSPWPTRSAVGGAGVHAVWLLSMGDSSLQAVVVHRMMESGPDEAPAALVAILDDRVRVRAGRKQLYGTQLRVDPTTRRVTPLVMEDSAHVDMRRDAAALPPLAAALCAARKEAGR